MTTTHPLKLYNTLSRRAETFVPLDPSHVRMYVCGPTVYDFAHIGNGRPVVVFDILFRLLQALYPRVSYVRNITDVDDKINAAAAQAGVPIEVITQRTTAAYHEDMAALGTLPPTHEPRATQHISGMIALIEHLITAGHAYAAEGHVLFSVPSFKDYGRLSGRSRDDMIAGARVEVAPYKKDPADFVLWKPSSPELPGWESPWGRGRPGWHIECSAMSKAFLGTTFDLHGGGQDLVFPHHENEIAQSTCAHEGAPFAHFWVHNGWVTVNGEKMSKSLGNFLTVRDLLAHAKGEEVRYALMASHYRQPLDWTDQSLPQAKATLNRLYTAVRSAQSRGAHWTGPLAEDSLPHAGRLGDALLDDMNVPLALSHLHEIATAMNKATDLKTLQALTTELAAGAHLLGILQVPLETWFQGDAGREGLDAATIESLLAERQQARATRDFARADAIRTQLEDAGIGIEDSAQGSHWHRL